jgi:FlxA-like protein
MMQSTGSRITEIIESTITARLSRLVKRCGGAGSLFASTRRLLGARPSLLLPGVRLPGRPGLLLLTALLLGLLSLVLTFRFRSTSGSTGELVLLSDPSSSNLNKTSAAAPLYPPTSPTAVERSNADPGSSGSPPKEPASQSVEPAETPAVDRPTETPVLQVPERLAAPRPEKSSPPAELPRPLVAEESLPSIPATELESAREKCYPVRGPLQGDTPMMRTWQMLGLKTLLAALFTATPGMSSETSGPPTEAERLTEIQRQLNAMQNSLTEVKKGLSTLEEIKTETSLAAQKVQNQIADINRAISQLRSDVENLRNRASDSNRIAASPPSNSGINTGTGRIDMINTYSQPVSIVLNNRRSYVLAPGERRLSDPIPAGAFTYEVLGVTPLVARTVVADKVFTLWVHPQP